MPLLKPVHRVAGPMGEAACHAVEEGRLAPMAA